jgi:hypothetical protein
MSSGLTVRLFGLLSHPPQEKIAQLHESVCMRMLRGFCADVSAHAPLDTPSRPRPTASFRPTSRPYGLAFEMCLIPNACETLMRLRYGKTFEMSIDSLQLYTAVRAARPLSRRSRDTGSERVS